MICLLSSACHSERSESGGRNPRSPLHDGVLTPNPPKDTDGRREDSGRVGEGATGEMAGLIGVDWRSANGLQSPQRAPMALCGSCDARDGERIRSRELSRTGVARVCREVGSVAGWQSGGEWNGSQPGHGASELGFPRPMLGKMQGKAARRAGDPSHQSEDPPPEASWWSRVLKRPDRCALSSWANGCAITCTASQAPLAEQGAPEGRWLHATDRRPFQVSNGVRRSRRGGE